MKFLYEYRTPDNAKHNGVISASDREAAYAALKKQGIKPSRFSEAPGLFNKIFGKGKRWIAIGVLGVLCLVLGAVAMLFHKENAALNSSLFTFHSTLDAATRRQPIGDPAVIDEGIRTGWATVFELEGERFLASFAIPGTQPAVRSTTEEELRKALDHDCRKDEKASDKNSSLFTFRSSLESDGLEARQIRAMVAGMKNELREFLAAGGSVSSYGRRLVQRQEEELAYYHRAKNEVEIALRNGTRREDVEQLLRRNNAALRKLGIRPVMMPER